MNDKKMDDRLLFILRNHPEGDPDARFVQQLRKKLTVDSQKKNWKIHNFKAIVSVCVSLTIILLLGFTFSGELQQALNLTNMESEPTPVATDQDEEDEKDPQTANDADAGGFELSPDEADTYQSFKADHDDELLRDLSPVSIAKIYIQARVDKDFETEYALYTTRENDVQWTLDQHLENMKDSDVSGEAILEVFANLGAGEFKTLEENRGVIQFKGPEYDMSFQMIKEENGIWKVGFMPTQ